MQVVEIEKLNASQRRAYDIIKRCDSDGPTRMIVYGSAGTGKSYLIHCLKAHFGNRCRILAPTGTASFNVGGQTLHSAFWIPVVGRREMQELTGQSLLDLQEDHKQVCVYLIDEVSMIGWALLGKVDKRMRQAVPHAGDQVFGGRSVIFFGDFGQLYPVMDAPLFSDKAGGRISDMGRAAYLTVDHAVVLTKVERQRGDDEFRELLLRLRNGVPTRSDFARLQSRFTDRVPHIQDLRFKEAAHVYTKREEVAMDNIKELRKERRPIAVISAKHTGVGAGRATAEEAGGLEKKVLLCEGAKIMLTKNICTGQGLCNGTLGIVHSIIYRSGNPPQLPDCIICRFPGYCGTPFDSSIPCSFPVFPARMSFEREGNLCSREQIPLQLAWAVTVHKKQGATLENAVVSIGDKEFSPGLTYVALSRVKRLKDLLLVPFLFQRISSDAARKRMREGMCEDKRIYVMDGYTAIPDELLNLPTLQDPEHDGTGGAMANRRRKLPAATAQRKKGRKNDFSKGKRGEIDPRTGSVGVGEQRIASFSTASAEPTFNFVPVSHEWMLATCDELGISIQHDHIRRIRLNNPVMGVANTRKPSHSRSHYRLIEGDGNCFYRAISFTASGDEAHHWRFRQRVANLVNANLMAVRIFAGEDNYGHLNVIERDKNWAGDVDIVLMAYLLGICIYVYQKTSDSAPAQWARYGPDLLNNLLPPVAVHQDYGIYLDHYNRNHFNLVTGIL